MLQFYSGVHGCLSWAAREYPPSRPRRRSARSFAWARHASCFAICPSPIPRRKYLATHRARPASSVALRPPAQCRPLRFLRARRSRPPLGPRRPARRPHPRGGGGRRSEREGHVPRQARELCLARTPRRAPCSDAADRRAGRLFIRGPSASRLA